MTEWCQWHDFILGGIVPFDTPNIEAGAIRGKRNRWGHFASLMMWSLGLMVTKYFLAATLDTFIEPHSKATKYYNGGNSFDTSYVKFVKVSQRTQQSVKKSVHVWEKRGRSKHCFIINNCGTAAFKICMHNQEDRQENIYSEQNKKISCKT